MSLPAKPLPTYPMRGDRSRPARPTSFLAAAISALQTVRYEHRTRPALVMEIDRLLGRIGDLRRGLLEVEGEPPETAAHGIVLVAEVRGVQARCLCSWMSPLHAGVTGSVRDEAWRQAKRSAAAHLSAVGGAL